MAEVGHGSKMGQNEFDCDCVSAVFKFFPLMFYSPYITPQWNIEVYWLFRPSFKVHGAVVLPSLRLEEPCDS